MMQSETEEREWLEDRQSKEDKEVGSFSTLSYVVQIALLALMC